MPQYKPYPNEANTPSRKTRKGERNKTFLLNKAASRLARKARKEARLAREAALAEELEETVE